MPRPHDIIIAKAAQQHLRPLGFKRKGRSRTWLADHDWWIGVVEFQPSGWDVGSYLNVAAHWLWSGSGYISFDFGGRKANFEKYVSDEQFISAADRLAETAANEANELATTLTSIDAVADILSREEAALRVEAKGSWLTYNAGVAAAIAGRSADATRLLGSVSDDRVRPAAQEMMSAARNAVDLRRRVAELIAVQRNALRLPTPVALDF